MGGTTAFHKRAQHYRSLAAIEADPQVAVTLKVIAAHIEARAHELDDQRSSVWPPPPPLSYEI